MSLKVARKSFLKDTHMLHEKKKLSLLSTTTKRELQCLWQEDLHCSDLMSISHNEGEQEEDIFNSTF